MKKILYYWSLWLGILICPVFAYAQEVDFREMSLQEALGNATKEKKMVFLDFYTTWCGPCKKMTREVFSQKVAGDYFNRAFVCLKIDAEKGEGKELAKKYAIQGYPTFIVLKADGTEVYRTSGFRPADVFVDKIRKGVDPQWSPEQMARRYGKGERTPELVNTYALYLLEQGQEKEGQEVIGGYFNSLSAKKRVRPENFFLYSRYTPNLGDVKGRYLLESKEAFVKANGVHVVDSLLYNWLRFELMPYIVLRATKPQVEAFHLVKEEIGRAGLLRAGCMSDLIAIADVRMSGDIKKYLQICREKFPDLEVRDRFSILLGLDQLGDEMPEIKTLAAALVRDHMDCAEGLSCRVFRMKMLALEGRKDYTLRAQIDAAESGKVIVMGWGPSGSFRDTVAFSNHRIELDLAAKDTLQVALKLFCEELACPAPGIGTYYPNLDVMLVPGEMAVLNVKAEKGKVPQVEWVRGGEVGHDYYRLQYELADPAEKAYRQLMMDNIVRGGDIRTYEAEFDAFMKANKTSVMDFVRKNSQSYVSALNLLEHYTWFDENEIEQLYEAFPVALKTTACGKILKRKLEAGRPYRVGTLAADFTKKDMNGCTVTLSGLKGKYVLLDFWGSWCGPCRDSHPHLKELYRKYGKKMAFINVANENVRDLDEARRLWKEAVRQDGLTWTQILNNEGVKECNLLSLFAVSSFPTKILIDPKGKIVARYVGSSGDPAEQLKQAFGF